MSVSSSDLFSRGILSSESYTICLGQVSTDELQISPPGLTLNFFFVDTNDVLTLSFSSSATPVQMFPVVTFGGFYFRRVSDGAELCRSGNVFVFSQIFDPYVFPLVPQKNLPTTDLYSGTWYDWSFPTTIFNVPNTADDVSGQGDNGYFIVNSGTKNISLSDLTLSFLPSVYYDIDGIDHENITEIVGLVNSWVTNPSSYSNPSGVNWLAGEYINIYSQPFDVPMLWYPYCDQGFSCGDCNGIVLVGGIECSLNSQVTPPSEKPSVNIPFPALPFIPTGPRGAQGAAGIPGETGLQGVAGAVGPMGYRGNPGKGTSDTISWTSSTGLIFFSLLFILTIIVIYVMMTTDFFSLK